MLYIIVDPLCPASLKRHFLQSPSFRQAQSALIGQLTQCIVIGRSPQAHVGNVISLTIIVSFSKINIKTVHNVLSFSINSSPKWVQRRVTDTVMMLVYICSTQARLRKLTPLWCDPVSLSLSLSLTHTQTHTHTHACCFLWVPGNLHRHNGFNTVQTVCAIALHLPYT